MSERFLNRQIVYVDSDFKTSGSNADFWYEINLRNHDVDHVCLLFAYQKKTYYIVQSGQNTFTLIEAGKSPVVITIPIGNYSFSSFQSVVQTLLNLNSPNGWTYTMKIPNTATAASTGLYTWTCTQGNPSFLFGDWLYEQFGFLSGQTVTFANNLLMSQYIVNFAQRDVIYIHSDLTSQNGDDILEVMTGNGYNFSSVSYRCNNIDAYSKPFDKTNTNLFHFWNQDENQVTIPFQQNALYVLLFYKLNQSQDTLNKSITSIIKANEEYFKNLQKHIDDLNNTMKLLTEHITKQ